MTIVTDLEHIETDLEDIVSLIQCAFLAVKGFGDEAKNEAKATEAILEAIMSKLDYPRDAIAVVIEATRKSDRVHESDAQFGIAANELAALRAHHPIADERGAARRLALQEGHK